MGQDDVPHWLVIDYDRKPQWWKDALKRQNEALHPGPAEYAFREETREMNGHGKSGQDHQ